MNWRHFLIILAIMILLLILFRSCESASHIVLYSAQDEEYAEKVLKGFETANSMKVTTKFDTEANKSVSLFQELIGEKGRPRCDVFWNNEVLSTIRLERLGMLEPYQTRVVSRSVPLPSSATSPGQHWHPLAARARILLVNTAILPEKDWPVSLLDLTQPKYKGLVVMAKPWAGTAATQAVCLFEVLGEEKARQFHKELALNQINIAPGNHQAAEWAALGQTPSGRKVAIAMTDTDDAMGQIREGKPVKILYPDRKGIPGTRLGTLFIPNTLAIMKNARHQAEARLLVDYLLGDEVAELLAKGGGYQIPLNPALRTKLPPEIEVPPTIKPMEVDFYRAADLWEKATGYMRECFDR